MLRKSKNNMKLVQFISDTLQTVLTEWYVKFLLEKEGFILAKFIKLLPYIRYSIFYNSHCYLTLRVGIFLQMKFFLIFFTN